MDRMDLVFGRAEDLAIDPVCNMVVDHLSPPGGSALFAGISYYFCAASCRQAFEEHPSQYV